MECVNNQLLLGEVAINFSGVPAVTMEELRGQIGSGIGVNGVECANRIIFFACLERLLLLLR